MKCRNVLVLNYLRNNLKTELCLYIESTSFSINRCKVGVANPPKIVPRVAEKMTTLKIVSLGLFPAEISFSIILANSGAWIVVANCQSKRKILNITFDDANLFVLDATILDAMLK